MQHIVKRHGIKEKYDEKKVYASVYAAALNCHFGEQKAEELAAQVLVKVDLWVKNMPAVSSEDIRDVILRNIDDKDVKLMYKHHLDVC